jgi:hypothetical protein
MFNFFAKRKLTRQLGKWLSPELVQEVLDGRALQTPKIRAGRIEFIFVFVRAESVEQLAERTGAVVDAGMEHEAVVYNVVGPMVVMAFGAHGPPPSPSSRSRLVGRMREKLGTTIKIVHGAEDGHFGLFGSEKFLAFTFTFPGFDHALATLGRLEFGQTEEFTP